MVVWRWLGCADRRADPTHSAGATRGGEPWTCSSAGRDGMRGHGRTSTAPTGCSSTSTQDVGPDAVVFVMDGVAFPLDIAWFAGRRRAGRDGVRCRSARPSRARVTRRRVAFRWAIEAPVGAFADLAPDARLVVGTD